MKGPCTARSSIPAYGDGQSFKEEAELGGHPVFVNNYVSRFISSRVHPRFLKRNAPCANP